MKRAGCRDYMVARAKWIGGLFTLAVIALLVGLHLFGDSEVPMYEGVTETGTHGLYVCDPVPEDWADVWLGDALDSTIELGARAGYDFHDVERGACELCDHTLGPVACKPGRVALTIRDQQFGPDHVAETRLEAVDGRIRWATVLLPSPVVLADVESPFTRDQLAWFVLGHELVCHATGHGHVRTQVIPGVVARQTGHICNPSVSGLGTATEGISETR